ncbi:Glutamine transport system permease protein glnP, partial [human gut metagenome]
MSLFKIYTMIDHYFFYFALPMAFNDLRIDPFTAAVVTIMINSGAYIAEITRG